MADEDQPRRNPRKLQDVLNFCTEVAVQANAEGTSSSSAVSSNAVADMDPESKKYLSSAFDEMILDVPKRITSCLHLLATSPNLHEPMAECDDETLALDQLHDLVDDHPMNATIVVNGKGLPLLLSCVDSPHARVQELAFAVLGSMCQNNTSCQDELMKIDGVFPKMLGVVDGDAVLRVKQKALFAVSCAVRNYSKAAEEFIEQDGLSYLMRAMQSGDDALYQKSTFIVLALIEDYKPSVAQLVSMGYPDLLVERLCEGDGDRGTPSAEDAQQGAGIYMREHTTRALLTMCNKSEEALRICSSNEGLAESLRGRLEVIQDDDMWLEEREYISSLLALFTQKSSGPSQAPDEDASR